MYQENSFSDVSAGEWELDKFKKKSICISSTLECSYEIVASRLIYSSTIAYKML
jgi:hypothetical protein